MRPKTAIAGAPLFSFEEQPLKVYSSRRTGRALGKICQKSCPPSFLRTLEISQMLPRIWGAFLHGNKCLNLCYSSELQCIFPSPSPKHYNSFATMVAVRTNNPEATERNRMIWSLKCPHNPIQREFSLFGLKHHQKAPFSGLIVTSPMPGCLLKIISSNYDHQWCPRHHYQLEIIKAKAKKLKRKNGEWEVYTRIQKAPTYSWECRWSHRYESHRVPGKTWEGPNLSPLADLGPVLTGSKGWRKVIFYVFQGTDSLIHHMKIHLEKARNLQAQAFKEICPIINWFMVVHDSLVKPLFK